MRIRCVAIASVSAVFLAACAAVSGSASAATQNPNAVLAQKAYKTMAAGDTAEAIATYTKAIESRSLEPEVLANALLNRALGYQTLGQQQQAIDDYTAALRLDAMSSKLRATALFNRALSYQKVGRPALAIEDYTSALFLDSSFAFAYFGRANVLRDSGQYLFALADYDKALQNKFPDLARLHFNQALAYDALQRPDDVRKALSLALAANPQYAPAQAKLASLDGGAPAAAPAAAVMPKLAALGSSNASGLLVAHKSELPPPEAPSASLLAEPKVEQASVSKKIEDRLPPAEEVTASVDQPTEEKKIVAVEPVTEEAPAGTPAAAPAAAAAEAPAAPLTGWSVQIASAASEDAAWSTWKKMQKSHRVLADKSPIVVKADLGSKGTFYRVRLTGYEGQGEAKSACSKLRSGGVSCYVSKADS